MVPGSRPVSPRTLSDFESELVGEELPSPILPRVRGPTHPRSAGLTRGPTRFRRRCWLADWIPFPPIRHSRCCHFCALCPTRRRTLELGQTGSDRTSTRGVEVRSVGISPCQRHCVPDASPKESARCLICPPAATDFRLVRLIACGHGTIVVSCCTWCPTPHRPTGKPPSADFLL